MSDGSVFNTGSGGISNLLGLLTGTGSNLALGANIPGGVNLAGTMAGGSPYDPTTYGSGGILDPGSFFGGQIVDASSGFPTPPADIGGQLAGNYSTPPQPNLNQQAVALQQNQPQQPVPPQPQTPPAVIQGGVQTRAPAGPTWIQQRAPVDNPASAYNRDLLRMAQQANLPTTPPRGAVVPNNAPAASIASPAAPLDGQQAPLRLPNVQAAEPRVSPQNFPDAGIPNASRGNPIGLAMARAGVPLPIAGWLGQILGMSPIGQLMGAGMGAGMGFGGPQMAAGAANRGLTPMTPEQMMRLLQGGPSPSINPVTGAPYNPARRGDLAPEERARQDAWNNAAQNPQAPPPAEAEVEHNPNGTITANIPGRGRVTIDPTDPKTGRRLTDAQAIQALTPKQYQHPVQGTGGGTIGRYPNNQLQGRLANVMAGGGMTPNAIAGVFANIPDESGWNPASDSALEGRYGRIDQPRFRGDAAYAHGLFQEGGEAWNDYKQWLGGRNWRDPTLQASFMMDRFKRIDPRGWQAMNNAATPGQAAQIFMTHYLRPQGMRGFRAAWGAAAARAAKYSRGVPRLDRYIDRRAADAVAVQS